MVVEADRILIHRTAKKHLPRNGSNHRISVASITTVLRPARRSGTIGFRRWAFSEIAVQKVQGKRPSPYRLGNTASVIIPNGTHLVITSIRILQYIGYKAMRRRYNGKTNVGNIKCRRAYH